jgi:glycosyltransferase involved in cell wall biosynthesis
VSTRVPLLGASLIVKNEQEHLRRCLSSLQGLCDEIVIVDTGSTDNTIAIAREFGVRLLERPWNGDFAAARNFALDAMTSTWVMYIDADEEVVDADVRFIRQALESAEGIAAFGTKLIAHLGWTPYTDFRIWRHKPGIRFRGEIHESTLPDIRARALDDSELLANINVTIQHHGYEGDMTAKHQRNLPLLLAQLADTPRRVNLWNHLGRVYAGLGQADEAERAWREGIRVVVEDGIHEGSDVFVYASLADFFVRTGRDASEIIDEALKINSSYLTLKWLQAQNFFAIDKIAEALQSLRDLMSYSEENRLFSGFAYNNAMLTSWPLALIGDCLFELGDYDNAAVSFEEALAAGANPMAMRSKASACRMLHASNRSV